MSPRGGGTTNTPRTKRGETHELVTARVAHPPRSTARMASRSRVAAQWRCAFGADLARCPPGPSPRRETPTPHHRIHRHLEDHGLRPHLQKRARQAPVVQLYEAD